MLRKLVKFCDFVDRVLLKCLLEGLILSAFSLLGMLAAGMDGICASRAKVFMERRKARDSVSH
ncbi:MAG: hypothetical protein LBT64_00465 [Puniceicoccales bacterium]|jgi:hypothetical protein|nr:hypothetical protein [Puniceicoccales bacterium]